MKPSTLLRKAAQLLSKPRLMGACSAILYSTNYGGNRAATDYLECYFREPAKSVHWLGPLDEEHRGVRILACLFAAEIAEDEGN